MTPKGQGEKKVGMGVGVVLETPPKAPHRTCHPAIGSRQVPGPQADQQPMI